MSYDIFFVKDRNLSKEQMESFLDSDIESDHPQYITPSDHTLLESELENSGLDFDRSEYEGSISFDFPSFQIGVFDNQIALNIPYWEINSNPQIQKKVQAVYQIILQNGYQSFDPQLDALVDDKHDIAASFDQNLNAVKHALDNLKPERKWWRFW